LDSQRTPEPAPPSPATAPRWGLLDERLLGLRWRWRLAIPILIAMVPAIAWSLWQTGWLRFNYPSYSRYPVQGVDVSHHQGRIDWTRLAGLHARFAYVKASEGADFRDEDFGGNWAAARVAGVVPGAYHYFTLCTPGAAQAENFLAATAGARGTGLPPAVDLEFGGNCAARPSPEAFALELRAFLVRVEQAWGCQPVLYVTEDFYPRYLEGRFPTHALWVRDVLRTPRLRDGRAWRFWQFAHRAHLPGVKGFVDRNVFAGTEAEFDAMLCRGEAREPVASSR
jgi:lysozyme